LAIPDPLEFQFRIFHRRACELERNWDDLTSAADPTLATIRRDKGALVAEGPAFNPHRIKGLYLDFRVFELNDITKFRQIANSVDKHFQYHEVQNLTKRLRAKWSEAPEVVRWSGFIAKDFMETAFYSVLFHSDDQDKVKKIDSFLERADEHTLHTLLLIDIKHRLPCLQWLCHLLTPFANGRRELNMASRLSAATSLKPT